MNNFEYYKNDIENAINDSIHKAEDVRLDEIIYELYLKDCAGRNLYNAKNVYFDILNWLIEERQILTNEEQEYLKTVIAPFKNRIWTISKNDDTNNSKVNGEYISIGLKDWTGYNVNIINLPSFETGKMYKGMKLHKEYTAGELNL